MSEQQYEQLLKRMPAIAEAVNAFRSESVQQRAFQILVRSLATEIGEGLGTNTDFSQLDPDDPREIGESGVPVVPKGDSRLKSPKAPKKAKVRSGSPKMLGELDLKPDGKKSLKDFVKEKKPRTNEERFAVIIYYLQNTLKIVNITPDHVHTSFKEIGVRSPLDIDGALRMAARRKGWIDTSNSLDLKLKVAGENFVEHDLPPKDGNEQ